MSKNIFVYVDFNAPLEQVSTLSKNTIFSKNKIITDLQAAEVQVYTENL